MIGGSFGLLGFLCGAFFLFALGKPLAIAVEPFGNGQGENFGGRPKRMDNDDA